MSTLPDVGAKSIEAADGVSIIKSNFPAAAFTIAPSISAANPLVVPSLPSPLLSIVILWFEPLETVRVPPDSILKELHLSGCVIVIL